jgi:hypothetical protein
MSWILDVINFFSPHQWAVIGGTLSLALGGWGITALAKINHLKKKGEKLWAGWINMNAIFWPTVLGFIGAALTNLDQITSLAKLIPVAAPYAIKYGPYATLILLGTHTIVTAIAKFWQARKAGEPITNVNLGYSTTVSETILPASSFGTVATNRPTPVVQDNLIQL